MIFNFSLYWEPYLANERIAFELCLVQLIVVVLTKVMRAHYFSDKQGKARDQQAETICTNDRSLFFSTSLMLHLFARELVLWQ